MKILLYPVRKGGISLNSKKETLSLESDDFDIAVMFWYHAKEYSIREVAKKLGCNPNRVKRVLLKYKPGPRSTQETLALRSTDEYREKLRQTKLGNRNHQAKLTAGAIPAIRTEYETLQGTFTKTQAQHLLAKEYGVSRSAISDIVNFRTWRHI